MLAFNKAEDIVWYWDEPTITLDYDKHEFHYILEKNWKQNDIPNIVLSSATLPNMDEIMPMTASFKHKFNTSNVEEITQRVYHLFTRVSKGTLDLKHPNFDPIKLEMTDYQRRIYNAIRAHVIDQYTSGENPDLIATRRWKRNCFVWSRGRIKRLYRG